MERITMNGVLYLIDQAGLGLQQTLAENRELHAQNALLREQVEQLREQLDPQPNHTD